MVLSDLTDQQIEEWPKVMDGITPQNERSLDHRYEALQTADQTLVMRILAAFNPRNALHVDITKAYLAGIDEEALKKTDHLNRLDAVLKSGQAFPKEELRKLITPTNGTIMIEDDTRYKLLTCKLHGQGIVFREYALGEDIKTKSQQVVKENQLLVAEIDAKNGGYGVVPPDGDGAIVSSHYFLYDIDTRKLLPEYLSVVLGDRRIEEQVRIYVRGATSYAAIRANDFLNIKIPLPGIPMQREIAEKVAKWTRIVEGAVKITNSSEIDFPEIHGSEKIKLSSKSHFVILGGGTPSKSNHEYWDGDIPWISPKDMKTFLISDSQDKISKEAICGSSSSLIEKDAILIVVRSGILKHTLPVGITMRTVAINQDIKAIIPQKDFHPFFVAYYIKSIESEFLSKVRSGPTVEGIGLESLYSIEIPLLPLEVQQQIVDQLDKEMEAIENVRFLKKQVEKRIKRTLAEIWGDKTEENCNP